MIEKIVPYKRTVILKTLDYELQPGDVYVGPYMSMSKWVEVFVPLTPIESKINEIIDVLNTLTKGE
jgi:hypothetical protein